MQINLHTVGMTAETDSDGLVYLGYKYVFAVTTDSSNVTINIFSNQYGMWYARITKTTTGSAYVGKFNLYILCAKNVLNS